MQKVGAVHFNPKIQPHLQHNDRTNSNADNIHRELSHLNQCDKPASQALKEIDTLYKQAMSKLDEAKKKGRRTPKERSFHEAIFEIDDRTTMAQCQELADKIAELTGFRKIQVVLHKDEGHIDEQGKFKPHYHAHAVFFTLDKDTGKQLARQEASLSPRNLSKIQDIASEILQMQRGERYYKDKHYQDFLDKKAQKGAKNEQKEKIQYQPQAPSRIQSQNDFKRFKDQMRQAQKELDKQRESLEIQAKALDYKQQELIKQKAALDKKLKDLERSNASAFADLARDYERRKSLWKNLLTFGVYDKYITEQYKHNKTILQANADRVEQEANRANNQLKKQIKLIEQERNNLQELYKETKTERDKLKADNMQLRQELAVYRLREQKEKAKVQEVAKSKGFSR